MKICPLKVYEHIALYLLETGAISSFISTSLVRNLDLSITSRKKMITVAERTRIICHGVAKNIPVTFEKLKAKMEFLVVPELPIAVLMEVPEMKKLNFHINFGG